jgi:hypothetical protein
MVTRGTVMAGPRSLKAAAGWARVQILLAPGKLASVSRPAASSQFPPWFH